MCGISGVISLEKKFINVDISKSMVDILEHRGPDDSGYLFFHTGARHNPNISFYLNLTDEKFKHVNQTLNTIKASEVQKELHEHDYDLFLGFRRLAILDLSSAGHQPFSDLSKNIWLVFNGEIYNYIDLRSELRNFGHRFKSNCDTEVIVYSFVEWGIECVKKFNGMFSFALYDNFKKKLYLVRDRCGIKPMYWSIDEDYNFTFASEVKSILVYRGWNFKLDNSSLLEYLTFQNFLSNKTLYKDIFILEPGKYIEIDLLKRNFYIRDYWDFDFISLIDFSLNKNAAIDELSVIMESAVKRQMVSDVEVGSYLSGGIDTGILVAFASKLFKSNTLKTFTIGFDMTSVSGLELSFDERDKAEYMSYLFSTEHYEMVLKAGDMERCFEKLVYHLEEPRVGQSYPNFYASKLASKFVKVVLSGTGGDELFGGYPWRYHSFAQAKSFEEFVDSYYSYWHRLVDPNYFRRIFEQMIKEVGEDYTRDIFVSILKKQFSSMCNKKLDYDTMLLMAFYFEVKTFLHGLLIIEDKLSMAHGLEVRVPFLDNEVINLALRIPAFLKLSSFKNVDVFDNEIKQKAEVVNGKYILRLLANRLIGSKISELKKQGFTAPDTSWFKGESIEFVKKKLLNPKARIYNLMSRKHVKDVLEEHFTGRKNRRLFIWSLLYLEYWLKIYCNL